MATLLQVQANLQILSQRAFLEDIAFEAIRKTQEIAKSLQKNQIKDGFDNEGGDFPTYSRATELAYLFDDSYNPRSPKEEGQPYNYDDTGSFLDNITVLFETNQVSFWSTDEKTPLLVSNNEKLLGLNPENLYNYGRNTLLPIIQKLFIEKLKS